MGSKPLDIGNEKPEVNMRREALRLLARLIARNYMQAGRPPLGADRADCGKALFGEKP